MHKILIVLASFFLSPMAETTPVTIDLTSEVNNQTAASIKTALDSTTGPVIIRITSPGGSLFSAIAIEHMIQDHGNVTCICRSFCASAAVSILESCQFRLATDDAIVMMHQVAFNNGEGATRETDADNSRKALKALDYALCTQLTRRAKITGVQLCKSISGNHEIWLTAPEALKLGFIDQIVP